MENVRKMGFETATPIQALAIPPAFEGRDLIGRSQTGTGKTLAFGIPLIERFRDKPNGGLRGLVLAPTRELAIQIHEVLERLAEGTGLRVVLVYGGASIIEQVVKIRRGTDILVATPGRLLDFQGRGMLRLDATEIFVLDEADQMLDLGFLPQIKMFFRSFYEHPQTLLFSATMPDQMRQLASANLTDPVRLVVGSSKSNPVDTVEQRVVHVSKQEKIEALKDILREEEGTVLIFVRTKRSAASLASQLNRDGHTTAPLHGDMEQSARERSIEGFRSGKYRTIVATDVAARGLDIDGIAHVINYDLAHGPDDHIHRIGRTARMGATGKATTLVLHEQRRSLRDFHAVLGRS